MNFFEIADFFAGCMGLDPAQDDGRPKAVRSRDAPGETGDGAWAARNRIPEEGVKE